jgi:4-diphosphocytidyl-2-C-methyl-D-erythritol kinase
VQTQLDQLGLRSWSCSLIPHGVKLMA